MINLKIGTNTERKDIIVQVDDTLAEVLENNDINITGCALTLNGSLIPGVDVEKTFEELGVADGTRATLIAVMKADSAN